MEIAELGRRIREAREKLRLRQVDVANALQVTPQAVSKWERGENAPDVTTLVPLAKLLGTSTDWLLGCYRSGPDVFEATVLFVDIGGFARMSAGMAPAEIADWLNALFLQLTETVLRHGGVPVKYIGDAFLCFFAGADHRARAVRAATQLLRSAPRDSRITLSAGLNAGEVYLGAIGHPDYARPDILGDAVNLAVQIEGWASRNRGGIAAAASVVEGLDETVPRGEPCAVGFKGRAEPVTVHPIALA